jgi:hypothetical protein
MITRNEHIVNHLPHDVNNYILNCAYCRLDRRNIYGNLQSRKNKVGRDVNINNISRTRETSGISAGEPFRETYIEYDNNGNMCGCTVYESISRGRFIVEHYILMNDNAQRCWYLDRLNVLTRDELRHSLAERSLTNIHNQNMTDVIVYTSLYNVNKNTILKRVVNEEKKMCIICMENFQTNQIIREIKKCQHSYHQECFDKWAETNHRCPLCNLDFAE